MYSSVVLPRISRRPLALSRLAIITLLAISACRSLGSTPDDETDVVTVSVVNHHRLNVTVYNVAQGRRIRLGEVTAAANGAFKLHIRRLPSSEVQLLADPVGSSTTALSELLHVSAGDVIQWILETDLARSHVEIR